MIGALALVSSIAACSVQALSAAHSAVEKLPGVSRAEGIVLDILLGPAEDFNYVSRTTPGFAPPAR